VSARDWVLLVVRATGFALVTVTGGWATIPLTAAVWSALATAERHREFRLALAAMLSWALLLAWGASRSDSSALLALLGDTLNVPGWSLVLLTVAVPGLLAWSAAVVANEVGGRVALAAQRRRAGR
jgi:hypothetical protein